MATNKTTLLYMRCGGCASPCSTGEKFCFVCGSNVARARAQANAKITAAQIACKVLSKREVEMLYFHYVFGTYRSSTLSRRDKVETELFIEDTHRKVICGDLEEENERRSAVLSDNEIESLSVSDRCLDFSTYCEAMAHLNIRADSLERVRYLFHVYDGDLDGFLSRMELFQLLSSHIRLSAIVKDSLAHFEEDTLDREQSRERAKTKLYTWLKRYFPRYSSDVVVEKEKRENKITLSRTYEMLCKEKCGTVRVIDEMTTINVCSVMTMLSERDMTEFAEESKLVVGLPSSNPFVMKKK